MVMDFEYDIFWSLTERDLIKMAKGILKDAGYTVVPPPKPPQWPFTMTKEELFNQDEVWIAARGTEYRIDDMTLDYVANVLRFLRTNYDTSSKVYVALQYRLINAAYGYRNDDVTRPNYISPPTYTEAMTE